MTDRGIAGWALSAFMVALAAHLIAQQDEGPILRPKKPAPATLLVTCDLACNWKLDGEAKGHVDAGGSAKAQIQLGQHVVVGVTEDGLDQALQIIKVQGKGQTAVAIELKPVREARLRAQQEELGRAAQEQREKERQAQEQAAQQEAARLQDLRDHATERFNNGLAFDNQKRYEEARPLYQKACDGGEMAGCNALGVLYEDGKGVAQDFAESLTLYQKACDGGEMSGCANLSGLYYSGEGVAKNDALSRTFAQKACDGGFLDGCLGLGILYYVGQDMPHDYSQARTLFQKVCDGGGLDGCALLGKLYESGQGVARNRALARAFYKKACDGGIEEACANLRHLH
jgi:tetratricopeptide (TPR) repeat protein